MTSTSAVINSDNALNVPLVSTSDFSSHLEVNGSSLTLTLKGNADIRVMFPLEQTLKVLEREILAKEIREVTVDLRALDFMNSSCLKTFVTWLGHVQEYEPAQQYPIRFLSSDSRHWQARSLQALSCFAVDLVRIEAA